MSETIPPIFWRMSRAPSAALVERLEGWHVSSIREFADAAEFADAFIASPDGDDLEDSMETIEAACAVVYQDAVATKPA